MEIERKWMVTGWPEGLTCTEEYRMDQGYISVRPTVRIRREALTGGPTRHVLCFKGEGTLSRELVVIDPGVSGGQAGRGFFGNGEGRPFTLGFHGQSSFSYS